MASKRYSQADRQKMIRDNMAELRGKGVDAQTICTDHPGGAEAHTKEMLHASNIGKARDQSQQQTEENKVKAVQRGKESKANHERRTAG